MRLPVVLLCLAGCAGAVDDEPAGGGGARATRPVWVREQIDGWNRDLSPDDREAKYARMAESPLAFFRGTSHLFWRDQAPRSALARYGATTWVTGDCHLQNFGSYDDDQGRIVYGVNDFDDAWLADYQLDLWRLATSVVLFARERGLTDEDARRAVSSLSAGYLAALRAYLGNDDELATAFDRSRTQGEIADLIEEVAAEESPATLLARWTDGQGHFDLDDPDLAPADPQIARALVDALGVTARDVAERRNAGVASLGLRRFYVLLDGDVILDVKETRTPPASSWAGPPPAASQAEVAATAERALVAGLGARTRWLLLDGRAYRARPLSPWKDDLPAKKLARPDVLVDAAGQWGRILATAHARADRDFDPGRVPGSFEDEVLARVGGDEQGFVAMVWQTASSYAGQARADHEAWRARR